MNGSTAPAAPRLGAAQLLEVWDYAAGVPAPARGVSILCVALPEYTPAELLELSIGQRDRLLIELLAGSFTPVIDALADCGRCGEPLEVAISCERLLSVPPAKPIVPLHQDGALIHWRPPNSADLLAASTAADNDAAEQMILQRCVLATDAAVGLAQDLRADLVRAIDESDPLADIQIAISCPDCGYQQDVPLDVADFLWREISGRAMVLLRDVATLAKAYGWSEAAVLAMPPNRRLAYLDLVNG